jgi:hypothetical protein
MEMKVGDLYPGHDDSPSGWRGSRAASADGEWFSWRFSNNRVIENEF